MASTQKNFAAERSKAQRHKPVSGQRHLMIDQPAIGNKFLLWNR